MALTMDFSGKHVFVAGGTTGINFGIAQAFARHGARLTVVSRKQENVDAAVVALAATPAEVFGAVADVRDFDSVGHAFEQAVGRFGAVDVLVSGAAGNFLAEAKDLSANGFKVVVDIDLNGAFNVLRQGYARLARPGAAVINISAPQAVVPMRYQSHVCAAKAGVDQLTRVLAMEWGPEGIRVNAISPGPIDGTEGMKRLSPQTPEGQRMVIDAVPLKRLGTVDDIAHLAMFLASPYAGYVSGTVIPCDGGGATASVGGMIEAAGQAAARRR